MVCGLPIVKDAWPHHVSERERNGMQAKGLETTKKRPDEKHECRCINDLVEREAITSYA